MKRILILLAIIGLTNVVFAQNDKPEGKKRFDIENFKAQKMAYLIREVGITPEESAELFPLYNEMTVKRFKLKMEAKRTAKSVFQNASASDADCLKAIDEVLNSEVEIANLEKTYYQKFKKILSPQKLLKLKRADMQFAQEVIKKIDKRMNQPSDD